MIWKVWDEFSRIDMEELESKNKNDEDIIIFPNHKFLTFEGFNNWEEGIGMGGTIEEDEEEKDNSANVFLLIILQ